jgi:hypothetical protein
MVTMKNVVFWDLSLYGSCRKRRFEETHSLHLQGENNQRTKNTLAIAKDCGTLRATVASYSLRVFSSLIVFTLKIEAIRSPETSVPARTTRRHIPEDAILHPRSVFLP